MPGRLKTAFAFAFLGFALSPGAAGAETSYRPPPPYQPPSYAPPPYTPPSVQQQPLPPPPPAPPAPAAAPPTLAAPSTELPLGPPAPAEPPPPKAIQAAEAASIRDAINGWVDDFNALKSAIVCDLFAPDLKYDFGIEPGNYSSLCKRLRQALGDPAVRYRYAPDIQEILISGNLAVVHIVWTLSVSRNGKKAPTVVTEPAMFVMRHDPDGNWRVFRFLAFDVPQPQPKPNPAPTH
ncbi:MAG: YybH family protein [Acetobacteraceae bacterium]